LNPSNYGKCSVSLKSPYGQFVKKPFTLRSSGFTQIVIESGLSGELKACRSLRGFVTLLSPALLAFSELLVSYKLSI